MSHLDALASAFHDGGLPAALAAHQRQRRRSLRYAAATAPIDACLPLADLCDQIVRIGDDAARRGIGPASRAALRRWELDPVVVVHPRVWGLLERGPFLAYGNQVTGLGAVLFSSLSARPDLYHLAGTFVATASPGLAPMLLTLANPARDEPGKRQPLRERMLRTVESAGGPADPRRNLATLRRAAELIEGGAGVHVFPAGTMHRGGPWQPGAGWVVRRLRRDAYVFPVVYGISDAHLAASALFRRRPLVRALARAVVALSGPPSIYVPAPVRVDQLGLGPRDTSREVTELLLDRWRIARAEAATAIPRRRAAPTTLRAGTARKPGRHRPHRGRPPTMGTDGTAPAADRERAAKAADTANGDQQ